MVVVVTLLVFVSHTVAIWSDNRKQFCTRHRVKYTNKKCSTVCFVLRNVCVLPTTPTFTLQMWNSQRQTLLTPVRPLNTRTATYTHVWCSSPYNTSYKQNENCERCVCVCSFYLYSILPLIKIFLQPLFLLFFPYLHFSHFSLQTDEQHRNTHTQFIIAFYLLDYFMLVIQLKHPPTCIHTHTPCIPKDT